MTITWISYGAWKSSHLDNPDAGENMYLPLVKCRFKINGFRWGLPGIPQLDCLMNYAKDDCILISGFSVIPRHPKSSYLVRIGVKGIPKSTPESGDVYGFKYLPKSTGCTTLQGTNISPKNVIFEDDFPFPQVGYVSFLRVISLTELKCFFVFFVHWNLAFGCMDSWDPAWRIIPVSSQQLWWSSLPNSWGCGTPSKWPN